MAKSIRVITKSAVAAKVETTRGTAEALTVTEGVYFVENAKMQDDKEFNERKPAVASAAATPGVTGLDQGSFTGSIEMRGLGSTGMPAWFSVLLRACGGLLTSQVWTPSSVDANKICATIGLYSDGRYQALRGAMGNAKIVGEMGKPVRLEFDFKGLPSAPVDVATIAPTFEASSPIICNKGMVTIGGSFVPVYTKWELDLGNVIALRPDLCYYITSRKPMFKIDIEQDLIANYNANGLFRAGTTQALAIAIGSASNNTFAIAAPAWQIIKAPGLSGGANGEIATWDIEGQLCYSTVGADDDLSITAS